SWINSAGAVLQACRSEVKRDIPHQIGAAQRFWVSVAWPFTKTFSARPRSASRRLAHSEFESKGIVNQGHVHCKPLLGGSERNVVVRVGFIAFYSIELCVKIA